jgi:hypothetical protein
MRSDPRTVGVSPAQAASLRAEPNRVMTDSRASMSARASWTTSAETAGRSKEASQDRPGPLQ